MANKKYSHDRLLERFWAKVDRRGDDDCWVWTSVSRRNGYAEIYKDGIKRQATQVSWEIYNGVPFPRGMIACHTCDNPPCVNPKHIWPGTNADNSRDARDKGHLTMVKARDKWALMRRNMTHCKNGHPLSGGNLYITTNGSRQCKKCSLAHKRKYKKKMKEAREALKKVGIE